MLSVKWSTITIAIGHPCKTSTLLKLLNIKVLYNSLSFKSCSSSTNIFFQFDSLFFIFKLKLRSNLTWMVEKLRFGPLIIKWSIFPFPCFNAFHILSYQINGWEGVAIFSLSNFIIMKYNWLDKFGNTPKKEMTNDIQICCPQNHFIDKHSISIYKI